MKILVTGANGFIGRHTVDYLIKNNYSDIYGMIRTVTSNENTHTKYVKADLSGNDLCRALSSSCGSLDAIVHVAACLSKDNRDPELIQVNCHGMQSLIETAHQLGCKRFVYISGIPVIGKPIFHPITEGHPTVPGTTYHASKLFGEHLLLLSDNNAINPIILRLPSPVGKGMNSKAILPTFINNCIAGRGIVLFGKGSRRQNYIDVRDICIAIELALQSRVCGVYNIANRRTISNYELAEICKRLTNSSAPVVFNGQDDPEEGIDWNISIEKAFRDLCFDPRYSIYDTIQSMINE